MKIHIVKKGDTLYFIGQKYNVSLEEILKLNPGITNPDVIEVGTKLKIPSSHTGGAGGGMDIMHQHLVKQGDTLWKLSKAWGVPLADMIKANPQLKNPNVLLTGEIVNIPKAGGTTPEVPGGQGTGNGAGGAQSLLPTSIMQGVQGWAGKLSTAPIIGKTPTGPIAGKIPTAPIAPVVPVAPVAPVAPVQEKKPAAPIVKPVAPAPLPVPKAMAVEPAKKALPIEKPVEKKLHPVQSEYKPNVDLFKQYGIPATEALSFNDYPKASKAVSPIAKQPTYSEYGYGQPMTMPSQTGYGYGQPMTGYGYDQPMAMPSQTGYGNSYNGWQQPVPFGNTLNPLSEGNDEPFECPPGTVFVGSYPPPSTLPIGAGPGWGYGQSMVNPLQQGDYENNNMLAGASAFPNPPMVSPLAVQPNQGMVSPMSMQPNQGMVSPMSMQPNQGMVSPMSMQPNQGIVSPMSIHPNQGMVSPMSVYPNQGMVSPMSMHPNQGFVSPSSEYPDYGYGYGYGHGMPPADMQQDYGYGQGMGMPASIQPEAGYNYGYPAAGSPQYPSYPPYPTWPQTAGVGDKNKSDCGCKGNRTEQSSAKLEDDEIPKAAKTAVQRKNTKKAVIRTVTTRTNKTKNRSNQPWINR